MIPILKFRPHHFLCTLGFEGKGYSDEFVRNFSRLATELRGSLVPGSSNATGDSIEIQVVEAADFICLPCPNREGEGCSSGEKIGLLDKQHALILGLVPGDRMTWGNAKKLLAKKMTLEAFHRACAPCSWKSMGVCETALRKLKEKAGLFFLAVGISFLWSGNEVARCAVPAENLSEVRTIEELRTRILPQDLGAKSKVGKKTRRKQKKQGSLQTDGLKKAYEALQAQKIQESVQLASAIQKNRLFGDYGFWIAGQGELAEAKRALQARGFKSAQKKAQSSVHHSIRIIGDYPYSPFGKNAYRDIASAELIKGGALCGEKKWAFCMESMESAFQRISNVNGGSGDLGSIPPEFLEAYGLACVKKESERCNSWLGRLGAIFPKISPEYKALLKFWPVGLEKPKPSSQGQRLSRTYKAPDLDQASFDAAMLSYFEKKYSEAIRLFQQFLDDYPRSSYRFRAQFWMGRALTQQKKTDEAKKVFEFVSSDSPLTFYGLLASFHLNKDMEASIAGMVPAGVAREAGLSALELHRLQRAELLLQGGIPLLAGFELKDLKPREIHSNSFLIYLAMLENEAGNHQAVFSILGELIQRGYPGVYTEYVLKYIFPTPFLDLIREVAAENKIDPVLLLSLIKQESAFDSSAVSSAGAQGLGQLMPGTALEVAPGVLRSDLTEAKINANLGAKYLSKVLAKFNGNITLALAGYNAGPHIVEKWVKAAPQRTDMLEFIEAIPYKETRDYVAAIIRNYYWYTHFFQKGKGEGAANASPNPPLGLGSDGVSLDYFWANYKPE